VKTRAVTFHLEREINAITGQRHIHIAAGTYVTEDREIQKVLAGYPGVTVQSVRPIEPPAPIQPGQFGHAGEQVRVTGGFSWDGVKGKQGAR
jgi:hypothetical protein